jgi:hypothetical protein
MPSPETLWMHYNEELLTLEEIADQYGLPLEYVRETLCEYAMELVKPFR